tara:strand:- start:1715 stop:2122 length:408 start_codon:yes stop_codon:yes gene_type:complete
MGFIQTTLVGNVDADPKLYTTESGYNILTLRVKVETRKKAKGTFQDFRSWWTIKIFGDRCSELSGLSVGDLVLVKGELRRNKWMNKEGEEQISYEIAADYAELLSGTAPQPPQVSSGREIGLPSSSADDDMDLPF